MFRFKSSTGCRVGDHPKFAWNLLVAFCNDALNRTAGCHFVEEGDEIKEQTAIVSWDPHHNPILAEVAGVVRYEDVLEGKTFRIERDADTKVARKVMIEHKGELHPQVIIEDEGGNRLAINPLPEKAYIEVEAGQKVVAGTLLAKTPREIQGTQDITGGLPRVTPSSIAKSTSPAVLSKRSRTTPTLLHVAKSLMLRGARK